MVMTWQPYRVKAGYTTDGYSAIITAQLTCVVNLTRVLYGQNTDEAQQSANNYSLVGIH